jgi:HK97 family phage major capsid protein
MEVNLYELNTLDREYTDLQAKASWNTRDKERMAYLRTAISAVKAGARLADVNMELHNERSRVNGLPVITPKKKVFSQATETEVRGWQELVNRGEQRDMAVGNELAQLGTYTGLGYFIPTGFFPELFRALKAADALFNEECCTLIQTQDGRPLPIPIASDIEHTATVIGEAGSTTTVDIASINHAVLGAYSYMSDRYVVSIEAMQDLSSALNIVNLSKEFFQDKLARGIAAHLVNGNGSGEPLGLIPSLQTVGVAPITASGSAENTGGTETGATSLGNEDFAAAYAAIDSAYLASPKAAWLMNQKTLGYLQSIVTKMGQPLHLVEYVDGVPTIYGLPVRIAPSMEDVGISQVPVILGDFRYWATRLITADEGVGIKVFTEGPGLAENGQVAIRCFMRAHGALLWNDVSSPCPFVMIRNHS